MMEAFLQISKINVIKRSHDSHWGDCIDFTFITIIGKQKIQKKQTLHIVKFMHKVYSFGPHLKVTSGVSGAAGRWGDLFWWEQSTQGSTHRVVQHKIYQVVGPNTILHCLMHFPTV